MTTTTTTTTTTLALTISGMSCPACVAPVTEALSSVPGASCVAVTLTPPRATLQYPSAADPSALVAAVVAAGWQAALVAPSHRNVELRVHGMTCGRCVAKVTAALQALHGVTDVDVQLDSARATMRVEPSVDDHQLVDAVLKGANKDADVVVSETVIVEDVLDPPPEAARSVVLHVAGMTCMNCVNKVKATLEAVDGVSDVDVHLDSGRATMLVDGPDDAQLIAAVKDGAKKDASVVIDDPPLVRPVVLRIDAMTCMRCVNKVTDALAALPTARDVSVSLEEGRATLLFAGPHEHLVKAVADGAGKVAVVLEEEEEEEEEDSVVTPPHEEHTPTLRLDDSPRLLPIDLSAPAPLQQDATVVDFDDTPYSAVDMDFDADKDHQAVFIQTDASTADQVTTQLRVSGMTCSSCVGSVESALSKVNGVTSARVNLLAGRASVVHDISAAPTQELATVVGGLGFQCRVLETTGLRDKSISANGSTASCFRIDFPSEVQAQNALKVLRFSQGVDAVEVTGRTASVTLSHEAKKSHVLRTLEADGLFGKMVVRRSLQAERAAEARGEHLGATDVIDEEAEMWRKRFYTSFVLMVPIMAMGIIQHFTKVFPMRPMQLIHFALATPIQFICGRGFYRASYFAVKKGRATMDVLVAISTSIAYFSSVFVVMGGNTLGSSNALGHTAMFNVSAMIITMVLAGKWLETSAKRTAAAGVAALIALSPEYAVLVDERDGVSCNTEVPVKVLDVGDVVRLLPGDRVPTDGNVIDGMSAVNESMLTGESNPVPKKEGDFVYGGTSNGGGAMLVRTSAVGQEAVLSQIVKLVNDAQTSRAPIEMFADRVSAIFVPAVVTISLIVFLGWYGAAVYNWIPEEWWADEGRFFFALLFALETMVIACPCALGLATPTAVMVASEVGSQMGVLFRGGGAALEAAKNVRTVLFDKTGTLTNGNPDVAAVLVGERGSSTQEQASVLLSDLIYVVESESHHPLASAIKTYLHDKSDGRVVDSSIAYKISALEELPGRGVEATVNQGKYSVRVGSRSWAFGENSNLERELLTASEIARVDRMESEDGLTVVAAVVNDSLVAIYGLEDSVRKEAEGVVSYLQHKLSVECHIVTGDSEETGRAVARKVGIPTHNLRSRAMPWTKVDAVKSFADGTGCFVGDGINDAPALAASSLGIAIGAGAPVAAQNADVVVVGSDLRGIVNTLSLARATFRRVRLNFIWAIGYNLLGIPLAAGILFPFYHIRIPPWVASAAMGLSSSCVVMSSVALKMYKAPVLGGPESPSDSEKPNLRPLQAQFTIGDTGDEIGEEFADESTGSESSWRVHDAEKQLLVRDKAV